MEDKYSMRVIELLLEVQWIITQEWTCKEIFHLTLVYRELYGSVNISVDSSFFMFGVYSRGQFWELFLPLICSCLVTRVFIQVIPWVEWYFWSIASIDFFVSFCPLVNQDLVPQAFTHSLIYTWSPNKSFILARSLKSSFIPTCMVTQVLIHNHISHSC